MRRVAKTSRATDTMRMSDHRTRFLELALRADALRFGEFTLKSGRLLILSKTFCLLFGECE